MRLNPNEVRYFEQMQLEDPVRCDVLRPVILWLPREQDYRRYVRALQLAALRAGTGPFATQQRAEILREATRASHDDRTTSVYKASTFPWSVRRKILIQLFKVKGDEHAP